MRDGNHKLWEPPFIAVASPLFAQTFDFENGIAEWTRSGSAFDNQPYCSDSMASEYFARVTLGGTYWRDLSYPLGQHGRCVVSSGGQLGDGPSRIPAAGAAGLEQRIREWSYANPPARDGEYIAAVAATGQGQDALRQETVPIPEFFLGTDCTRPAGRQLSAGAHRSRLHPLYHGGARAPEHAGMGICGLS
jgi:hypothetical protein